MPTRVLFTVLAFLVAAAPAASAQSELVIYKEGTGLLSSPRLSRVEGCDWRDGRRGNDARAGEARGHKPHADCDPDQQKLEGAPAQSPPPAP
jgi:hypothetical protein